MDIGCLRACRKNRKKSKEIILLKEVKNKKNVI